MTRLNRNSNYHCDWFSREMPARSHRWAPSDCPSAYKTFGELYIKAIGVTKYSPDCMKLIFNAESLGPIVDELLNILCTKRAGPPGLAITVWSRSLYPTRIVKDKAGATRVCYLVVDHAPPTLELMLVRWENKWKCLSMRRTCNPPLTSVESSYNHQLDYRC